MAYTQDSRSIAIATPLGKDKLLLKSIRISEQMGRPFVMKADLLSEEPAIDFLQIIGKGVTIRWRMPDLVVIDGGKGQVSAAREVLDELGLHDMPVVGLAKEREELFLPGRSDPILLPARRLLPPVGGLDLSPWIAMLLLNFANHLLHQILVSLLAAG